MSDLGTLLHNILYYRHGVDCRIPFSLSLSVCAVVEEMCKHIYTVECHCQNCPISKILIGQASPSRAMRSCLLFTIIAWIMLNREWMLYPIYGGQQVEVCVGITRLYLTFWLNTATDMECAYAHTHRCRHARTHARTHTHTHTHTHI